MTPSKPEFIRPHVEIKEKAVFVSEEQHNRMIEKAESIVENMRDDYVEWSKKDVEKLKILLKKIKSDPSNAQKDITELFDLANDIKSQGGSFNYDLVTFIGNSLCKFINKKKEIDAQALETIQIHVDTIIMVLNRNMMGDGGAMGKEILDGIKAVVQKILAQDEID